MLKDLMPWNTNDFYRYEGSLTTPGCYEVVTWTIFQNTVKVTEAEVRTLKTQPQSYARLTLQYILYRIYVHELNVMCSINIFALV